MKKLLSLPENVSKCFHDIENKDPAEWFCAPDPINKKIGSGGASAWLLSEFWKQQNNGSNFDQWLGQEKKIIIHAGGRSRRLPAYAPIGKILTPLPVFRWERGQNIDQTLIDLQLPLFEKILAKAPKNINTLIGSGDVYVHFNDAIEEIPDADVVCCGLWADPSVATNHGVFVCDRVDPKRLLFMLQKPTKNKLQELARDHLYLMDVGIWLLSDRAVKLLVERTGYNPKAKDGFNNPDYPNFYDLYYTFGLGFGEQPTSLDKAVNQFKVTVLPLTGGKFYHYGTNKELISSSLSIQNMVSDQRSILHKDIKPHPSMFVQNAEIKIKLKSDQQNLWIENSYIGPQWQLSSNHIITGIPENNWDTMLGPGQCFDIIPVGEQSYCLRPYGINDTFKGELGKPETTWMELPLKNWFTKRNISLSSLKVPESADIQSVQLFPVLKENNLLPDMIRWMLHGEKDPISASKWIECERLSADQISTRANLFRLYGQRDNYRVNNLETLLKNYRKSVFFQVNLDHLARKFSEQKISPKTKLPKTENSLIRMQEQMFLARIKQYRKENFSVEESEAFSVLRESLIDSVEKNKQAPKLDVHQDQIVWGRSPVRIDLAGGWTDTPPGCILSGGAVTNFALELNGQPPLQVYLKPSNEFHIILRSIDAGDREDIYTYEELSQYNRVGSPFSIPKAALILAGFHADFSVQKYSSLEEHLKSIGAGLEISTLAAIPKGSGLGTSSILASTILGSLSDFYKLGWNTAEICQKTLVLEQLLTTGGGWQDQYGGVLHGIKLLETSKGFDQSPNIRWAPDYLFTNQENKACMLLYFTGITRTAKDILSEIVRGIFLNAKGHLSILKEMKRHAVRTFEAFQQCNFNGLCDCVKKTWEQKQLLDQGTNPPEIQALIQQFDDLASAYKLPGAGGGGYMYIIAKDPESALKIKKILNDNPPNNRARFVDMDLSQTGFQVTRS
jgi:galactokinase/mevalonate kinase-like predicted kinase